MNDRGPFRQGCRCMYCGQTVHNAAVMERHIEQSRAANKCDPENLRRVRVYWIQDAST